MYLCIIYIISFIVENKKKMEKKIFIAMGLQYLTEKQLLLLLCIIGIVEGVILL